ATRGDEVGIHPTFSAAGLDGPSATPIALRVTDNGGLTSTAFTAINVTNVAPTVSAGGSRTVNEGSLVQLSAGVTDPGPDTFSYLWHVVSSNGQTIANGTSASFSFTPNDNGTSTATLTVTDDDGGVGSSSVVVTVNNAAPTASAGANRTVNEGSAITLFGTFTDPGSADTWTFNWHVVSSNG